MPSLFFEGVIMSTKEALWILTVAPENTNLLDTISPKNKSEGGIDKNKQPRAFKKMRYHWSIW